jgi:hypothetical protein
MSQVPNEPGCRWGRVADGAGLPTGRVADGPGFRWPGLAVSHVSNEPGCRCAGLPMGGIGVWILPG